MSRRMDRKGLLWAAFFLLIILALIDVLRPDSMIVDFFSGTRTPEGRLQRAMRRAVER